MASVVVNVTCARRQEPAIEIRLTHALTRERAADLCEDLRRAIGIVADLTPLNDNEEPF